MIRLLVADDHPVVRNGIRHLLRDATDMRVAAEAGTASDVLREVSSRELEIMLKLVRGVRPKEIAMELGISEKTVATHRARLMTKLNVDDNRQLLLYALKAGLTDWA
jgi:DNA-binding NarL/FixJ family response regulator